jgi:MFS family permease
VTAPELGYLPDPAAASGSLAPEDSALARRPTLGPAWALYSQRRRWIFLIILFFVILFNYFDYFVLSAVLDPIKREFGVSDTMLGLLSGPCFALLYGCAAIPIARWADRGNRRTIITLALAGWSVMTAVCGLTQSFTQLAVARLGVGVSEPGAAPPALSLIADYFPPERRASAMAILTQGGSAAGCLIGIAVGGVVAATYGWRIAFIVAGIPGIALALLVRFTLAEPRTKLGFPHAARTGYGAVPEESAWAVFCYLYRKRSFRRALLGISIFTIFSFAVSIFLPSFMIRTLHASLMQVSITWGVAVSVANLLGAIAGGFLADSLSKRDIRWYQWLPSIGCALGSLAYWEALHAQNLWAFIRIDFVAEFILAAGLCVSFAAIHAVCGDRRRAMATGIVFFAINLFGTGLGPFIAGALSDVLNATYGIQSLRYSLLIMVGFLLPASGAFYWGARAMPQELEA